MSQSYIPVALRKALTSITNEQCEYCRKQSLLIGEPLQIDHVVPVSAGGQNEVKNLCFACARCNLHKGNKQQSRDPHTEQSVPLFHPRTMHWDEHFAWADAGLLIMGRTAIGRATVEALNLNNSHVVRARQLWIRWDVHPP